MAIIFVSAQKKQKAFFSAVAVFAVLFAVIASFIIFLPELFNKKQDGIIKEIPNKPVLVIDVGITNSDKFKALEPFETPQSEYVYVVQDQKNETISGNISAGTKEGAQALLESAGFKVTSVEEKGIGRTEPFAT